MALSKVKDGMRTTTALDATLLSGNLPAISGTNLTNLPAANLTGTLPAISGASLTNLPAGGKIVQVINTNVTAALTGTTAIPIDDTIPHPFLFVSQEYQLQGQDQYAIEFVKSLPRLNKETQHLDQFF